jgi:threonine synthase
MRREFAAPALWLKDETSNPSGSNKDRATALVLESGRMRGVRTVTTASTGNAALSTAVGAAAMDMRAVLFVPSECSPYKLAAMRALGADVFLVDDGYRAAVALSRQVAKDHGWLDRNTGTNPLTLEGKKTVAFEIWEQLGFRIPQVVVAPVGDGATLVGLAKGFRELCAGGHASHVPRLIGVQAERCQPLVRQFHREAPRPRDLEPSATVADGIAVIEPAVGVAALREIAESRGDFVAVAEQGIRAAQLSVARSTGLLIEPAAAAAVAGFTVAMTTGSIDRMDETVVVVTGRGPIVDSDSTALPHCKDASAAGLCEHVAPAPTSLGIPSRNSGPYIG